MKWVFCKNGYVGCCREMRLERVILGVLQINKIDGEREREREREIEVFFIEMEERWRGFFYWVWDYLKFWNYKKMIINI